MSKSDIEISVIVPIYNEEKNIVPFYQELSSVLKSLKREYEIICVDDGSKDNTLLELRKLNKEDPHIKVVSFRRNFGQTAAISAGFDYACGDIVISIDADLENRPENIPDLIKKLEEGYDVVCGWRYERWGGGLKNLILRRIPSEAANFLVRKISKLSLHDIGCTLRAYRSFVVKDIKLYGDMHRFIPVMASINGAKISEIKVDYQPRKYGKSKYGFSRTFKVFVDLILLKFLVGYATKPSRFFGLLGFWISFIGILFGGVLTYDKLVLGQNIGNRPLLLLAVLLVILGAQFITMGLLAEVIMRTYYESQNKKIYSVREVLD